MPKQLPTDTPLDAHSLDRLMSDLKYDVPNGFSDRVMRSVTSQSAPEMKSVSDSSATTAESLNWMQWSALIGGGILGIGQIVRIMLGLWFAATAW